MPRLPDPFPPGVSVYEAVADPDTYALARGVGDWTAADDEERSFARVKAADWLNALPWKGARVDKEQADAWPRIGVLDAEGVEWVANEMPPGVANAFCEMCFVFLAVGRGETPDPNMPVSERERVETGETIGPLSFQYSVGFKAPLVMGESATGYPVVDGLLAGLLRGVSGYGSVEIRRG